MSDTPKEAIPSETLRDWIMNPCRSKSEQEWWAAREIEKLERERDQWRECADKLAKQLRRTLPCESKNCNCSGQRALGEFYLLKKNA